MEKSPRKWTVGVRTETQGSLTDRERNIGWLWNFILHLFSVLRSYEYAHSTCVSIPIFLNNLESFFYMNYHYEQRWWASSSLCLHTEGIWESGQVESSSFPVNNTFTNRYFFVCSTWRQSANTNKPAEETRKEMRKKNSWSDPEVVDLNKLIASVSLPSPQDPILFVPLPATHGMTGLEW